MIINGDLRWRTKSMDTWAPVVVFSVKNADDTCHFAPTAALPIFADIQQCIVHLRAVLWMDNRPHHLEQRSARAGHCPAPATLYTYGPRQACWPAGRTLQTPYLETANPLINSFKFNLNGLNYSSISFNHELSPSSLIIAFKWIQFN